MLQTFPALVRKLMLPACLVLLNACSTVPAIAPVPPQIPPLPLQARQPLPPTLCQPTCSAGLSMLLDSLESSPIKPSLPDERASRLTTH